MNRNRRKQREGHRTKLKLEMIKNNTKEGIRNSVKNWLVKKDYKI